MVTSLQIFGLGISDPDINMNEPIPSDPELTSGSLFYPVVSSQSDPSVDINFPLGFDISDIFDIVIPQIPS